MTTTKPSAAAAAVGAIQPAMGHKDAALAARVLEFIMGCTLAAATSDAVCFACHFGPGPRM